MCPASGASEACSAALSGAAANFPPEKAWATPDGVQPSNISAAATSVRGVVPWGGGLWGAGVPGVGVPGVGLWAVVLWGA